jgi:peptide/nickel transport system substrate-binding protein
MTRSFLFSLLTLVVLVALLLATTVNVWQVNRTERRIIDMERRVVSIERAIESGALSSASSSGPIGGIFGVPTPPAATSALQDPANMLRLDPMPVLPPDAKQGGTLFVHMGSNPKGFNVLAENGADVQELYEYVSSALIRRQRSDPSKWDPEFAYSMVTPDDGLTYIFKLRQDFVWQKPIVDDPEAYAWLDGEHKVTAHDVKFMLDMVMNDQVTGSAPLRSYYEQLESYRVVDDYTFEIKFSAKEYSQRSVALPALMPIPEFLYAYDSFGERYEPEILGQKFQNHWYKLAIGCGPYQMTEYESGVKIVLERNPAYPLGGNAFEEVVYRILPDQNAPPRMLRTKELHLAHLQPGQYRTEVLNGDPSSPFKNGELTAGEWWTHSYFYIGWNIRKPLFADKRVRQAMSHAFNGDKMLDEVFLGLGERCTGPMPTFLPYYDKSVPGYAFDLDKAIALLEEAGWVDTNDDGIRDKMLDGVRKEFVFDLVVYGNSDEYTTLGSIFSEDLAQIGVKMNVRPMEWSLLLKNVNDREFDAVTLAWVSSPDVDFNQIWHSSQADTPKSSNHVGFKNAEADAIIEEMKTAFEYRDRVTLAHRFHNLLHEEQPYTFFYTRKRAGYWQPELSNVQFAKTRPYKNHEPWFLAPAN